MLEADSGTQMESHLLPGAPQMSTGKTSFSLVPSQSVRLGADPGLQEVREEFQLEGEERLSFWTEFCGRESDCSLLHL